MKKFMILYVFSVIITIPIAAKGTISISDLVVNSNNPKLTFIGKGVSELIAYEIAKSKDVSLVEREKRTEMLKEMELSQSGLISEEAQIKMGKMLSAKYMVFGDITDMGNMILITLRMIDVETSQVVWREKLTDKLSNYDYISGFFASSMLKFLRANVDKSTETKIAEKKEKNDEGAIAFSNAINSYDKKDETSAKRELDKAKRLDPENRLVDLYLSKLAITSPKYKIQLELYALTDNPATLGFLKHDKTYVFLSNRASDSKDLKSVGNGYSIDEQMTSARVGYSFPLGEKLGLGAEFIFGNFQNKMETPYTFPFEGNQVNYFHPYVTSIGGYVSGGYRLTDNFSLGAGFYLNSSYLYYDLGPGKFYNKPAVINVAGDLGFLLQGWNETLVLDSHVVLTSQMEKIFDTTTKLISDSGLPTIVETTLTTSFLNRKLFFVLKNINDIYSGVRTGYVIRAIPVVEFWAFKFLSLRAGYQFAAVNLNNTPSIGHGFIAGTTIRVSTIDIDFNFTQRYQPARVLPGYGINDQRILIGITKNDSFLRR